MTKSPIKPNTVQSCCLLRLSALGDITHVVPLIRALQEHWPECQLTWLTGPREYELVSNIEGIEFIVFNKKNGLSEWAQLRRTLKGRSFDILLQLQTSFRANLLSTLIKAQRRIGWDSQRAREGHRFFINEAIGEHPPQHQVQGFLAFARHLGIPADKPNWNLPIQNHDLTFAKEIVSQEQQTLIISPCSSHEKRDWSLAGYKAVALHAIQQLNMQVIICGGPSQREKAMGASIAKAHSSVINFVGRDTLPQLVALLSLADILISPDSGPAHIANAVGTKVIGLHAATWSRRSGPYHSLDYCVDRFELAAQRFRHCKAEQLRWGSRIEMEGVMNLIDVDEVIAQLNRAHQSLTAHSM